MEISKDSRIELNDGNKIPLLGFSTYTAFEQVPKDVIVDSVKLAIENGYRQVDSAFVYQNETEIGEAVREKIADGTVKREEMFHTGKLWLTFLSPELVRPCLEKSLKRLQFDYLDLFLIHWPVSLKSGEDLFPKDENGKFLFGNVDFCDTWEAMEACKDAGLVKSIGVSNFNQQQLQRLLNKPGLKYKPVVNQVECHLYLNQSKLLTFCKAHHIAIICYSVLGTSDAKYWGDKKIPVLLEDPVLLTIAERHKRSPSQIALRYIIQRGMVALVKSKNPERIKSNLQVLEFQLTDEDMKNLDSLNKDHHFWALEEFKPHPEYPFSDE